jgi:hypothetical protein
MQIWLVGGQTWLKLLPMAPKTRNHRVIPTSNAIDESADLAHEIMTEEFCKVSENLNQKRWLLAATLRGWWWQESPNLTQECRCDCALSDSRVSTVPDPEPRTKRFLSSSRGLGVGSFLETETLRAFEELNEIGTFAIAGTLRSSSTAL